ncbi:hypothetical protein EG68_04973 [Paragonimus skrjabini miyazakii]|uniref:Uncharacterized protein n=1 Tax=Paragonimus skrjabini miyazakii TaxID=59628 RepID=A0A8S9YRU8_9TREM|nr:hypothetical protein EG68_04973 [Paragonimus skrjabini miyazakii]
MEDGGPQTRGLAASMQRAEKKDQPEPEIDRVLNNRYLVPPTPDSLDERPLTPTDLLLIRGEGLELPAESLQQSNGRVEQCLQLVNTPKSSKMRSWLIQFTSPSILSPEFHPVANEDAIHPSWATSGPMEIRTCGRSIDGTAGNLSNLWSGECLHDLSAIYCRVRGFSPSLWIRLFSVSKERNRFILSTGDSGTGIGECITSRGISNFTDKLSLGASVSHQYTDWKLSRDSNGFEEGKWSNIGLSWRQDVGLTLLVDGVQSTSSDEGGTTTNTEKLAQPYVVLGRLNDRSQSTWLTPYMADWENSRTG